MQGDGETVDVLLSEGVGVDSPDPNGWTPLMMAAMHGHLGVIRLLLDRGAAVDATNGFSGTALRYAAKRAHAEVVSALLAAGAALPSRIVTAILC
jgi:ankyrin repeat protein